MAAPDATEHADLSRWSFIAHYRKYYRRYVAQGRVLIRNNPSGLPIEEEELADGLRIWMESDPNWARFLDSKIHLPDPERSKLTNIMARYIAYKDFVLITT